MQVLPMQAYREQVIEVLERSPLFHGLESEDLEAATEHAELLRFDPKEALTQQGRPADSFLLLIEGSATVMLEREGQEPLALAQISPPDSIGEMGVLLDSPRTASVYAERGAIVLRFPARRFHAMLLRLPYFGLVMCRTLAARLHLASRAAGFVRTIGAAPDLDDLLHKALDAGASDVHLAAGRWPMMRIDGKLQVIDEGIRLGPDDPYGLIEPLLDARSSRAFSKGQPLRFSCEIEELARVRVRVRRDARGVCATLRLIPLSPPTVESAGLPAKLVRLAERSKGLLLVSGRGRSGRTTTLAALVDHLARSAPRHIITIEDPIEFVFEDHHSLVTQQAVGVHGESTEALLAEALHDDPDVVVVDRIDDEAALRAVLPHLARGALVIAGTTADDPVSALETLPDRAWRVMNALRRHLIASVSQSLAPSGGGVEPVFEIVEGASRALDETLRRRAPRES